MGRQWTQQQHNAIYATDGSVLVSAAAGSGKTAVLVERVIKLITREENPIDIDRLLIVTFTRAAASEMRQRLSAELSKLLAEDPYNPNLLKQRQLLYNASISTIDSFCGDVVREYFHHLNVSRDFRIADEGELEILRIRALNEVFEDYYSQDRADFTSLADAFSSKGGDIRLRETVLKISEFLSTQPFPEKWMNDMLGNHLVSSVAYTIWGRLIIDYSHSATAHAINLTESTLKLIEEDEKLYKSFSPRLEEDFAFLNALQSKLKSGSWNEIASHIADFSAGRLTAPKGYKDNPLKLAAAANRDEVKSTIKQLQEYFAWSEQEALFEISELHGLVSTLFELTCSYLERLSKLKADKNILSFADIELLTVKLFAVSNDDGYIKTRQAYEISSRYDAVMVDEFQDVNDVQDLIFRCVSTNEENLFVVGDVKQSIYGFRQAKPKIFINRKNSYNRYSESNPEYPAAIILDKNFRSRKEVCDAVNFIFSKLMTKTSAGMDYSEDEMLNVGADYPESSDCGFELAMLDKSALGIEDSAEAEACYIAQKIRKMMSSGFTVKDGSKMRRAKFSDFAVILRSPSSKAAKYVSTLNMFGIPAYSENKENSFDAPEIKIILNLLRIIDNPALDIPLLSVMCSPIYGFNPDELSQLRAGKRYQNLYASVVEYAQCSRKAAAFLAELDSFRKYACTCSVDELIGRVYETTAFASISTAVKGGGNSARNLNVLREYARNYEHNGCKTLSEFISFIDKLIENGTRLPSSSSGGEEINGVRVLSIHASKGLEYPVCFIADTAHKFNKSDLNDDILLDSHAGLGIRRRSGICRYNTLPRLAVGIEISRNEIAEELRVLYVALTRAREKLIVVSAHKDVEKYLSGIYAKLVSGEIIESYAVVRCGSICDWITLCALVHPSLNNTRFRIDPFAKKIDPKKEQSEWHFDVIKSFDEEQYSSKPVQEFKSEVNNPNTDEKYAELLRRSISFEYPNSRIMNLPQKVSASEAAHNIKNEYFERVLAKPNFIKSDKLSAVERGTAHHRFLQYCDFSSARNNINGEIERLLALGALTQQQAKALDSARLERLLSAPLISRVLASDCVMREEQFFAKLKPSDIYDEYKNIETDCTIIIQGAVDLAFKEDGKLVIVDYKTDRVSDISKLPPLYEKQLKLYSLAMAQSTGLEVKERIICSVILDEFISV